MYYLPSTNQTTRAEKHSQVQMWIKYAQFVAPNTTREANALQLLSTVQWLVMAKVREQLKLRYAATVQTEFLFKPSQLNKYPNAGKYCSRKCGYEYRVKKGADKPTNDKWGRTGRKADVDWKLAVRAKFSCICQRCGIYNEYVDTHHIYTRSHRPDLKHEVSNGVALCRSCHSWVHHNPREAAEIETSKRG